MPLTQVQGQMLNGSNNTTTTIQSNGTTAITIDSSQNVGIGTSSPSFKLDVIGAIRINEDGAGTKVIQVRSNWAGVDPAINVQTNNPLLFNTNGTERMRITSGGNVGIGTSSPATAYRLSLTGDNSTIVGGLALTSNSNSAYIGHVGATVADCEYWNAANGYVRIGTNNTERMRITSGGALVIGGTGVQSSVEKLSIISAAGNANNPLSSFTTQATSVAVTMLGFYDGANTFQGQIYCDTASNTTVYATSSDYRLKENIAPMTGALAKVQALNPVTYTWKKSNKSGQGFIAHELAEIVPECVIGEKDAEETYIDAEGNEQTRIVPQMVDTSFLVATLTAAIQELKAELDATKAEVAELKAKGQ